MKFRNFVFLFIITLLANLSLVSAQTADSVIGQITSSARESFVSGISGDGRLVVFESTGNLATENPRNIDANREVFLFDYAQRRIYQITDTRSLLTDTTKASNLGSNIKVEIANIRPVISNDGRWIAFGSNATIAFPGTSTVAPIVSTTNPGSFDANAYTNSTGGNNLTNDGNTEMWLYQIPALAPVGSLSSGSEIAPTDLSGGAFLRVTNTVASSAPAAATATVNATIADDNREASLNNDGGYLAFISTRDLAPTIGGVNNASPNNNDEVFTFVRSTGATAQVTQTTRGTISSPIFNGNPSISGNGLRVAFLSNGNNPVAGMTGGANADGNVEIFYTDLNAAGQPVATAGTTGNGLIGKQITNTTRTTAGQVLNVFNLGRRMSLDGRFIALDSYADLANENAGANQTSFALYVYDTAASSFRRFGPRSDADAGAAGGDVRHYPGFTDYDSATGAPQTLVFETRLNIKTDGTIPATAADGLNPDAARPTQIYSSPLAAATSFTRLTKFPATSAFIGSTQPIPSNRLRRMSFTIGLTEIGTGNSDLANEVYYLLIPTVTATSTTSLNFFTGASRQTVSASPVPTPAPGTTPTPSPSPTPVTPSAVQGVSPGMLAIVNYGAGAPVTAQTAVGSLDRRFTLPIELSNVSITVNGAAAGIKSVAPGEAVFVVPPALNAVTAGTIYPIVINDNGTQYKGSLTLVPARPDVFTFSNIAAPNGRARIYNATNRVLTTEPFTVTTVKIKGGVRTATVFRLFLTGVESVPASAFSIRVGDQTVSGAAILTGAVLREPGVYSVDFTLPAALSGKGDLPIIVTVTGGGVSYQSRLDDTAPRFRIL